MSRHLPVLAREVLSLFSPVEDGCYLDATFGGGGHTRHLLEASPRCSVVALDRDPEAEERAHAMAAEFPGRFQFHDGDFRTLDSIPESGFAGILFDLGLSSFQLDDGDRGFSFREDAPVDMRMDPRRGIPAAEFLEKADRQSLIQAVREFGEEPRWRRVVSAIEGARGSGRLQRTKSLADLIAAAVGTRPQAGRSRIHPATRSFQGIRIAVNDELGAIAEAIPMAFAKLATGGVLAVISFHSLEDRLVKRAFRRWCGQSLHRGDSTPRQLRSVEAEPLTSRPISATPEEVQENPRARSAKLRAIRKNTTQG